MLSRSAAGLGGLGLTVALSDANLLGNANRHPGRDFRLTDVHGIVNHDLFS